MSKQIICLCFALLCGNTLFAQSKVRSALDDLNTSDLILHYDSLANIIEGVARTVKQNAMLTATDRETLRAAYSNTADRFNNVLQVMRNDLLAPEQRRLMRKNPAAYAERIKTRLNTACKVYQDDFLAQKRKLENNLPRPAPTDSTTVVAITNDEIDGFIIPISLIVEAIVAGYDVFKRISADARQLNEKLLDTQFVPLHKFKTWEEL